MIVYFSGTGNSRYAAMALGHLLSDEVFDASGYIRHNIAAELISEKPWVFVCPTYAWQIPRVFEDFIKSGWFQGSSEAYFIMTCGGDTGNASERNRSICESAGLNYKGTLGIKMPENYIALFPAPNTDEAHRTVKSANLRIKRAADVISKGNSFPEKRKKLSDKIKSSAVNRGFYSYYINDKGFFAEDSCSGCGKCESVCPLGNISLVDQKPRWNGRCTHCMACISNCPTGALQYKAKTKNKRRYLAPEFSEQGF